MERVKLLLVGGFLGAGKTTMLYRVATELMKSGKSLGLVTNDQATDLVDTQMLASHGLAVSEVAGSCFCCNFNGLIEAARSLKVSNSVDILLAEPVGSCTDLSATICRADQRPVCRRVFKGPLSVLIDPLRAMETLGEIGGAFTPVPRISIESSSRKRTGSWSTRAICWIPMPGSACGRSWKAGSPGETFVCFLQERGWSGRLADGRDGRRGVGQPDSGDRLRHVRRGRGGSRLAQRAS